MTDVNPKTFDLAAVLSGNAYPKDEIAVYLSEEAGYRVYKINREIAAATISGDTGKLESLQEDFVKAAKETEKYRYIVHITGASRQDRKKVVEEVIEKYPIETNAFGQMKPNAEADDFLANLTWKLHIESIVDPSGAVLTPGYDDIVLFRGYAPDLAIETIEAGIRELSEGTKSGFESAIQEHDFLSRR